MTKYPLLSFAFLFTIMNKSQINCQTNPLMTLSFLESSTSKSNNSTVVAQEKYQKARSIYLQLIQVKGDYRTPIPKFTMNKNESNVASINYDLPEIILEEKAYDVCQQIGDEAIAFLLAHELTHYYEKHAWKNEFIANYSDLSIGSNLLSINDQVVHETQADYLGGFLAYTSGYGLKLKADTLLHNLYNSYAIASGKIPNYPSLNDRIKLIDRTNTKLQLFAQIFEMANYLVVTENFKAALDYYEYILMRFQSNKLYNNVGLCLALQAKQYFNAEDFKYYFPLELDNNLIFERDASVAKLRDSLLKAAIISFDIALGMDPSYLPAKLNKAICFCMMGEYKRALYYCEQEISLSPDTLQYEKTLTDNCVLLGIIFDKLGNKKQAKSFFEKSIKRRSDIGKRNLDIFNHVQTTASLKNNPTSEEWLEVNGFTLKSFLINPEYDDQKIVKISPLFEFYQSYVDSLPYKIFFNLNTQTEMVQYMMLIKSGSNLKSAKKIGEGSSMNELLTTYGNPVNKIETSLGSIWVYNHTFFNFGKSQKVETWGNFISKKL